MGYITLPSGQTISTRRNYDASDGVRAQEVTGENFIDPYMQRGTLFQMLEAIGFNKGHQWDLGEAIDKLDDGITINVSSDSEAKASLEAIIKRLNSAAAVTTDLAEAEAKLLREMAPLEEQLKAATSAAKKAAIQKKIEKVNKKLIPVQHMLKKAKAALKDARSKAATAKQTYETKFNSLNDDDKAAWAASKESLANLKSAIQAASTALKHNPAGSGSGSGLSGHGAKAAQGNGAGKPGASGDGDDGGDFDMSDLTGGKKGKGASWGDGAFGGSPKATGFGTPMDMNSLMMGNWMQNAALDGMDSMNKSESEGKKMMLLFFMLARMAMTGDLGAMYQFLRFIGHIINRDKAMQNVQLARKLIELQDVSRKLTSMLVNTPAHDPNDQGVQAEYMKLQQKIQAEQGVIATSQKLIAQMLEEFTQVSEMMTGMQKSLLDARGRQMQMLAVWRA
jgi:hypothetical protein